ncbi:hypothetical protein [Acidithiobacillus sp.]|uniref:hypothetical protein n=1 Tax=Acidithiobacillus sp. TaxID=1872118 RepID=UPI003D03FD1F
MANVWIANTSRKDWIINVRIPESAGLFMRTISSGMQEEIKGVSPEVVDAIVKHLQLFGALTRAELNKHGKNFEGLAYATDKAFADNTFHYGLEEHLDQAQSRSVVEATRAALAADATINNRKKERVTGATTVEMEQERPLKGVRNKMSITVDPNVGRSDKIQLQ